MTKLNDNDKKTAQDQLDRYNAFVNAPDAVHTINVDENEWTSFFSGITYPLSTEETDMILQELNETVQYADVDALVEPSPLSKYESEQAAKKAALEERYPLANIVIPTGVELTVLEAKWAEWKKDYAECAKEDNSFSAADWQEGEKDFFVIFGYIPGYTVEDMQCLYGWYGEEKAVYEASEADTEYYGSLTGLEEEDYPF